MVMTVTKAKSKPAAQPKSETVQKVDRLVELNKLILAIAPLVKEKDEIESHFKKIADTSGFAADQPVSFAGTSWMFCLDPKKMARTIKDMKAVAKAMGPTLFMDVAKVTLGDIDKYLSEDERASLLDSARTGPRVGKLMPKG